eukprot:Nitzschia sp. Nitz4//scaffold70_size99833//82555//83478//NITZ4_004608-RA/size99833-processed-gene-0.40-mRNA-1//-1//CDS//3329557176//6075//frame0
MVVLVEQQHEQKQQQTIDEEKDEIISLRAMMERERSGYLVRDYLLDLPAQSPLGAPVDAAARSTIAAWCIKVMDVCEYRRETAAIAISYLDRYCSTSMGRSALLDRKEFQLVALTAVYAAVKIHEPNALSPTMVAKLSNGERTASDIEAAELKLLQALQWRMHPPTAMAFVRNYLELMDSSLHTKSKRVLMDLAQYQIDISLTHYEYCLEPSSRVGMAALLNAMETIFEEQQWTLSNLEGLLSWHIDLTTLTLSRLQERLYEVISSSDSSPPSQRLPPIRKPSCGSLGSEKASIPCYTFSPRSVQLS